MDTPKVKAGCYLRISSDPDDKREGVDRQREDTTVLCEVQNWTPAGFYIDNNKSASNGADRKNWNRLLDDVKAGKIDAIVIWNQDRGWRKMSDFEALRPLLEPRGVLLATTNIGVIDVRNPDDLFRVQISTSMSEMEIAKMRVRMRRAATQKADRGKPQWKKAFGYLPDTRRKEEDDGTRKINPKQQRLVKRAYAVLQAGGSLIDIATMFNKAGEYGLTGKPWDVSTVSLFLRSPRNAGLRSHTTIDQTTGKRVTRIAGKGTWPPLVPKSTWDAAQAKLATPGRSAGPKSVRQHLLTGLLQCGNPGCDGYLSGFCKSSKSGGTRAYRCKKCFGVSVSAANVEPLVHDIVVERLARPDAEDLLKAKVHDEAEAEAIRADLSAMYAELDNIGVERADGLLTGRQAKIATDRINEKIAVLERQQQDHERLRVFDGIPLGTPKVAAAIGRLSPDRFRAVVDVMMVVTVKPGDKGGCVFRPDRVTADPK